MCARVSNQRAAARPSVGSRGMNIGHASTFSDSRPEHDPGEDFAEYCRLVNSRRPARRRSSRRR